MTNMENTVRPFTAIPVHPSPSANLVAPLPPGVVECKLGGSGGTTTTFSFNGQTGQVINGNDYKESSRSSSQVRVENPDDPTQYVTFCRADRITMKPPQTTPARTSSFDPTGGLHADSGDRQSSTYEYQYPTDEKTCVQRDPPKGGKC